MSLNHHQHVYQPVDNTVGRTLLLLHGTGGDERDMLPLATALDPHAARLSPLGNVRENGMPRFFRRLSEGVFDVDDLRGRTNVLADWIETAVQHYQIDPAHLTALGFSNGANIAAAILLLRPGVLRSAVLLSPMVPFRPDPTPDLSGVQILIAGGRLDPIAPPEQIEALGALLSDAGANVKIHIGPGGHEVSTDVFLAAQRWLAERPRGR